MQLTEVIKTAPGGGVLKDKVSEHALPEYLKQGWALATEEPSEAEPAPAKKKAGPPAGKKATQDGGANGGASENAPGKTEDTDEPKKPEGNQ